MTAAAVMKSTGEVPRVERRSLCLSGSTPGVTIHAGEAEFQAGLEKHFPASENNTAERLVDFKAELRALGAEDFWKRLMVGMTDICGAQFAFVSKRILVDDHDAAVEMPPIGEAGSCLMGVALYWNDGQDLTDLHRDYKYYAWNAPCAYMKHDKVFLCPEGLTDFVPENPNQLPFDCDAYLGVPLFADGKCFAHFGMMWTKDGLARKTLSWAYLEMLLHTLEDQISERLRTGQGFAKINARAVTGSDEPAASKPVIPQDFVTSAQSLKPYARSLSHELRTPMQGVVGMLDVMHATVQEQIEATGSHQLRRIFETLKENIETVQDSSKRAVEAADNVVHAYDLNMQVPDTPSHDIDSPAAAGAGGYFDSRPKLTQANIVNPFKRKRTDSGSWHAGPPTKYRHRGEDSRGATPPSPGPHRLFANRMSPPRSFPFGPELASPDFTRLGVVTPAETDATLTPSIHQSSIREILPIVIQDSLRVGGRPESAVSELTPLGEKVEVRTRTSNGEASQKTIEWSVDPDVPGVVAMDERDLAKLISAVFLNAIKFTESGDIQIHAQLSDSRRYVSITVSDTGSGIPADFQPELFKPFAKEDHSITRTKEGLGLGLLVAKGLARRTGGDITLVRSTTDGPDHGTVFDIRVPVDPADRPSRSSTPFKPTPEPAVSRTPSSRSIPRAGRAWEDRPSSPFRPATPARPIVPGVPALGSLARVTAQEDHRRPSLAVRRLSSAPRVPTSSGIDGVDRQLAEKYPLRFLVAEDNKINRKLLVNMLGKFGYRTVHEAFDGREAVKVVDRLLKEHATDRTRGVPGGPPRVIDVVLMDLWMPEMDGYEATEKILDMYGGGSYGMAPVVLAVSADVTEAAVDRATRIGMQGYMTKPYKLADLQRLILEFCAAPP